MLPMLDDRPIRREILQAGLRGLFTLPELQDGQVTTAPDGPGIYTVWRVDPAPPRFARISTAGRDKGRDPTIAPEELQARWVPDAALLYAAQSANVRTRVRLLMDFALGKPVAHDLVEGIYNLPVLHALAGPDGDELAALLGTPIGGEVLEQARSLVTAGDAITAAVREAASECDQAVDQLGPLAATPGGEALVAAADHLVRSVRTG